MKRRKGIEIIEDHEGSGEPIKKGDFYQLRLKMWLHKGDPVIWLKPFGLIDRMKLSSDGTTLISDYRIDREFLFDGLFYGILDMKIGGMRKLKIAPHLAYREEGVEGMIPPNALLTVEVTVLGKR